MTGLNLACVNTTTSMLKISASRRQLTSFSAYETTYKPTNKTEEVLPKMAKTHQMLNQMLQMPQMPRMLPMLLQIISQLDLKKISSLKRKRKRSSLR